MPSTWSQVLLHYVWSTKNRELRIDPAFAERLYPFIGGIVRDLGGSLWAAGGMPDHVHLLVRCRTEPSMAVLAREVKYRSSLWVHESIPDQGAFAWQKGYGVFSVSKSASGEVKKYIENQPEHHKHRDFLGELRALLIAHGVEYDERYLE